MTRISDPPSILDRVRGNWLSSQCKTKACDQLIDVSFVHWGSDPRIEWEDSWFFLSRCPDCILRAAPDDQKEQLIALVCDMRAARREVGLGGDWPALAVHHALRGFDQPPTLYLQRWYPSPSAEKPRDYSNDPYIEQFFVVGFDQHDADDVPNPAMFSLYPLFDVAPHPPSGTRIYVHLTQHVHVPAVPHGYIRIPWNPMAPSSPPSELIMTNVDCVGRTQQDRLWSEGMPLFDDFRSPGRRWGSGRFRGRQDCLEALLAAIRVLRAKGMSVTQEEVGSYINSLGTTRSAIMGDAPADPGRQVRRWCKQYEISFEALKRNS
jgi:hypothetical protein